MNDQKRLSSSRYIGRVGTLAVALGVGIAVASVSPEPEPTAAHTIARAVEKAPAARIAHTSQPLSAPISIQWSAPNSTSTRPWEPVRSLAGASGPSRFEVVYTAVQNRFQVDGHNSIAFIPTVALRSHRRAIVGHRGRRSRRPRQCPQISGASLSW